MRTTLRTHGSRLALAVVVLGVLAAAGGAAAAEYRLGPGDQVLVSVWGEESLTRTVIVRPDGKLSVPLIPEIDAAGRTVLELQRAITERLAAFVQGPNVSVILTDPSSYKIYVVGQVAKPGVYQLKSPTTVLQAVALAGGLTEFASAGRTVVHRKGTAGRVTLRVRLDTILKQAVLEEDIQLEPDDVVLVP
jgi:polysaccharide export outer membrane protein